MMGEPGQLSTDAEAVQPGEDSKRTVARVQGQQAGQATTTTTTTTISTMPMMRGAQSCVGLPISPPLMPLSLVEASSV